MTITPAPHSIEFASGKLPERPVSLHEPASSALEKNRSRTGGRLIVPRVCGALLLAAALVGTGGQVAFATTYYVADSDGSDSNPGTSTQPFKTIQRAADLVNPGDTVIVRDGTYTGSVGNDWLVTLTRSGSSGNYITFKAENKWGAVLDGTGLDYRIINFGAANIGYIQIQDFELRNTEGEHIKFNNTGQHDITIKGNRLHHTKGAASVLGSPNRLIIESNYFHDNGDTWYDTDPNNVNRDHAIYSSGTNVIVRNNIFARHEYGWAMQLKDAVNWKIYNNTFAFPNPKRDGHIVLWRDCANITITNNIFYQPTQAAIRQTDGVTSGIVLQNNLTTAGGMVSSDSNSAGWTISNNAVSTAPNFADASADDFRLTSGSTAAIDTGATLDEVSDDYWGDSRPQGSGYDLGADEYVDSVTPPPEPYTPPGPPLATGRTKFLGSSHAPDASQSLHFEKYWNQVTPESAGEWGSVEPTKDVMNWTNLDASYAFAKSNEFPFKMNTLISGSQQPAWMETMTAAQQLQQITEWFAAVAARYPELEMIDVVNEPISTPPDAPGRGNYIAALGGAGASGWDWVVTAFRMARAYFPKSKLLLNEYDITNSSTRAATLVEIINLLKAEGLIDGIGIQAHAFSTNVGSGTLTANLNTIAAAGVPIYITELDIDGASDQEQLAEYQRVFPIFWEHPSVAAVTLWGYRPGMSRTDTDAHLAHENGAERPALVWLREYLSTSPAGGPPVWGQPVSQTAAIGSTASFSVWATGVTSYQWTCNGAPVAGATASTLTLAQVQPADAGTYRVILTGAGGSSLSNEVTLGTYTGGLSKLINISTRSPVGTGSDVQIAGFVVDGAGTKRLLVRSSGPALGAWLTGFLEDPLLTLYRGNTVVQSNDNWSADPTQAAEIRQAAISVGAFPWSDGSKDAALVATLEPGSYTAVVSGNADGTGVALVEAYELDGDASKLVNISTRSLVRTGVEVQVAGFVVKEGGPKKVAIRASGPGLGRWGVPGVLADPVLNVYRGETLIGSNDNWDSSLKPDFEKLQLGGRWDDASRDAAVVMVLDPGSYTAVVSGKDGATGVALVEVYELD